MEEGKKVLFDLFDEYLNTITDENIEYQNIRFQNADIIQIIDRINQDPSYINIFLKDVEAAFIKQTCNLIAEYDSSHLNQQTIDKISENVRVPENFNIDSLEANLLILKGIVDINKKNDNFVLSDEQQKLLDAYVNLLKRVVIANEFIISSTNGFDRNKCATIRNKINNHELLTPEDYDFVTIFVSKVSGANSARFLNKIMTFINNHNAQIWEKDSKNDKKPTIDLIPIIHNSETAIKDALFEPNDIQRATKQITLADAERKQKYKELFAFMGFDYDKMDIYSKQMLDGMTDLNELESYAHYLIDTINVFKYLHYKDYKLIVFLLCNTSKETMTHITKQTHISDDKIGILLECHPQFFTDANYAEYIKNLEIFKKYDIPINSIIDKTPELLSVNNGTLTKTLDKLITFGANPKFVLTNCAVALIYFPDIIEHNITLLQSYGYNINQLLKSGPNVYLLLNNHDLAMKLDKLIELNLNDYIHSDINEEANKLFDIIIKRLIYSHKNNISLVWQIADKQHKLYSFALNSEYVFDYDESDELIEKFPILGIVEREYGIKDRDNMSALKKKTEYHVGNKIISRLKTLRVFKTLVDRGENVMSAISYAIAFNSTIDTMDLMTLEQKVKTGTEGGIKI